MLSPILFLCCSSTVIMGFAFFLQLLLGLERAISASAEPPFNNPPGVDIWCGKAYRETVRHFFLDWGVEVHVTTTVCIAHGRASERAAHNSSKPLPMFDIQNIN
jgi:hypothetical protein